MAQDSGNIAVEQPTSPAPSPSMRYVSVDARAQPSDFGGQIGQGLQQLSRGLDSASDEIMQVSDKRDALYAQNVASQAEVVWKQKIAQAQQEAAIDPSKGMNYANQYKDQFNAYQQNIMDQNPDITQNAKNLVMSHLNAIGANMYGDALSLQSRANVDWSRQTFNSAMDNIQMASNSPSASVVLNEDGSVKSSSFDVDRQKVTDLVSTSNGIVSTGERRAAFADSHSKFDENEIIVSAQQNGEIATINSIQKGYLGTSLTATQRYTMTQELSRQARIKSEENLRAATDNLGNIKDTLEQGGNVPPSQYASSLNSFAAAGGNVIKVTQALDKAKEVGAAQMGLVNFPKSVGDSSDPIETKATLDALQQGVEAGKVTYSDGYQALVNNVNARTSDIETPTLRYAKAEEYLQHGKALLDNAQEVNTINQQVKDMTPEAGIAYVNKLVTDGKTSPAVIQRVADYELQRQSLILPTSDKRDPALWAKSDPTIQAKATLADSSLQSAMGGNKQAIASIADYQNSNYAMQRGVQPDVPPVPITRDTATKLTSMLTQASASPGQATKMVDGIKQAFGDKAGDVLTALQTLTPQGQKMSMGLRYMFAIPSNAIFRNDFADSLTRDEEAKPVKEEESKKMSDALEKDSSWQSWQRGIAGAGGSDSQTQSSSKQMKSTILNYAAVLNDNHHFGVSNPESAVKTASDQLLNSVHGFSDSNGQPINLPRGDGNGGLRSDDDMSNISYHLESMRHTMIPEADLSGLEAQFPHMSDDEKKPYVQQLAKDNSFWATGNARLAKSNQAVLMFHNPQSGDNTPLLDRKGQPIVTNLDTSTPIHNIPPKQDLGDILNLDQ